MAIKQAVIGVKRVVPDFPEMDGEAQEMVLEKEIEDEEEQKKPQLAPVEVKQEEVESPKPVSIEDLSIADIRYILEQKLLKEAEEAAKDMKKIAAPSKAPKNMTWVFNRSPQKYEWMYDGVTYEIEGHAMELHPMNVARHARKRSILSLDAFTNHAVFRIALEGEEKFGVPLKVVNRTELIDRSVNDNPLGKGPGRTHPSLLKVDGVAELFGRRPDTYVELE